MKLHWTSSLLPAATLGALAIAGASQEPAATQPGQDPVQEQIREELESAGVRVDLQRKLIEIDASICQDREPLEYLLVTEKGKDHESLLRCTEVSAERRQRGEAERRRMGGDAKVHDPLVDFCFHYPACG